MRRTFVTLAWAGLLGGVLLTADAQACHKKRACPPPPCAMPAPCPPRKKCCGGAGLFKMKHRRGCGGGATVCYSGC